MTYPAFDNFSTSKTPLKRAYERLKIPIKTSSEKSIKTGFNLDVISFLRVLAKWGFTLSIQFLILNSISNWSVLITLEEGDKQDFS